METPIPVNVSVAGSIVYVIAQLLGVAARAKRADLVAYGLLVGLIAGFITDAVVTLRCGPDDPDLGELVAGNPSHPGGPPPRRANRPRGPLTTRTPKVA